jgi:hypothetical protein
VNTAVLHQRGSSRPISPQHILVLGRRIFRLVRWNLALQYLLDKALARESLILVSPTLDDRQGLSWREGETFLLRLAQ